MPGLPTDDKYTGKKWEELFPRHAGPPQVKPNTGADVFDERDPHLELRLDAGAFRGLWEILERYLAEYYPTHNTFRHVSAAMRGLEEFRTTYWALQGGPPPAPSEEKGTRRPGSRGSPTQATGGHPAKPTAPPKQVRKPGEVPKGRSKARNGPRRASRAEKVGIGPQDPLETASGALLQVICDPGLIKAKQPVGRKYLQARTHIEDPLFTKALNFLLKKGKIARVGSAGGAKYRPYKWAQ